MAIPAWHLARSENRSPLLLGVAGAELLASGTLLSVVPLSLGPLEATPTFPQTIVALGAGKWEVSHRLGRTTIPATLGWPRNRLHCDHLTDPAHVLGNRSRTTSSTGPMNERLG